MILLVSHVGYMRHTLFYLFTIINSCFESVKKDYFRHTDKKVNDRNMLAVNLLVIHRLTILVQKCRYTVKKIGRIDYSHLLLIILRNYITTTT